MRFTEVELDEDDKSSYLLKKFTSENGIWVIAMRQMMYGVRVSAWIENKLDLTIDYCAGADNLFLAELLVCIIQIMETFPEDVTDAQVRKIMPGFMIKPVNQDPSCWVKLQQLRYETINKITKSTNLIPVNKNAR